MEKAEKALRSTIPWAPTFLGENRIKKNGIKNATVQWHDPHPREKTTKSAALNVGRLVAHEKNKDSDLTHMGSRNVWLKTYIRTMFSALCMRNKLDECAKT